MHILVATDADHVLDDITAALAGPDTSFTVCRDGRDVTKVVQGRTPDLAILDLQVGSMGGMAITMALRLDESSGIGPHVPVLMLLDRKADLHLAKRSAADGWVVKPLDALTLQRAVDAIIPPPAAPKSRGKTRRDAGSGEWATVGGADDPGADDPGAGDADADAGAVDSDEEPTVAAG